MKDIFLEKWTLWDMIRELKPFMYEEFFLIDEWEYEKKKYNDDCSYSFIKSGVQKLGKIWDGEYTYFFKKKVKVPKELLNKQLILDADISGESIVYVNGKSVGSLDFSHDCVVLCDKAPKEMEILIVSTKDIHSAVRKFRMENKHYEELIFRNTTIAVINQEVSNYYYFAKVLIDLCYQIEDDKTKKVYDILKSNLMSLDLHEPEKLYSNIGQKYKMLVCEIKEIDFEKIFGRLILNGHSHLDLVFKWRTKETIRKIERTTANAINVINRFEHIKYTQSQMQLLEWMKNKHKEQYSEIKKLVKKGNVEIIGGLWVEFDTNIPSGESIVRQILYGQNFMMSEFGFCSNICYLPDTFGYSGILPQILRQSGYEYFITNKLSWNDTNIFPYNYFQWEGIDGSRIKSYLNPIGYSGPVTIERFKDVNSKARQKDLCSTHIFQYGEGDGGGGISDGMVRYLDAISELNNLCEISYGSVKSGIEEIDKKIEELPIVKKELYFEKHRGVMTSQAKIKHYNRKLENKINRLEKLFVMLKENRTELIEENYKKILYNQFHDTISGTIVEKAVKDTINQYEMVENNLNTLQNELVNNRFARKPNSYIFSNYSSIGRKHILFIQSKSLPKFHEDIKVEKIIDNTYHVMIPNIKPYSFMEHEFEDVQIITIDEVLNNLDTSIQTSVMENEAYKITFDKNGHMSSIISKKNNEEYLSGLGNEVEAFINRGGYFDAWDIKADYAKYKVPYDSVTSICVLDSKTLKVMKITRKIKNSVFVEYVVLDAYKEYIELRFEVDINDHSMLYKLSFDTNIDADYATYDLSYGHIDRTTHNKTSVEKAQFEVAMQKWFDLSNKSKGLAIMNQGKYGGIVKGTKMSLSLIKTAIFPDPNQDIGEHKFNIAIYPYHVDSIQSNINDIASEYNGVIEVFRDVTINQVDLFQPMKLFKELNSVRIEVMKFSENKKALVLRLVETSGMYAKIELNSSNLYEADLLERKICKVIGSIEFTPFEIKTIMIDI